MRISELLKNTVVRIALGVAALIVAGSVAYYLIQSRPPQLVYASVQQGSVVEDVTADGTVSPVQNPSLSFEVGGQVKEVNVKAGDKVAAGEVLATLDTSVLSASLAAAQAQLSQLEAPARSTDVAGKQTAVQTAQQALNNTYTNFPITLQTTYSQAQAAVSSLDVLYDTSTEYEPALLFTPHNYNEKITADSDRQQLYQMFDEWQKEISTMPANPTADEVQTETNASLDHLDQVRTYLDDLITALSDAQISPSFTQSQDTADLATANAARGTVNGLISSLTAAQQSIATNQLAVQSAQDALNQTLAGSTSQTIQAQQAAVAGIEAQITQQEIIAPFSGTVASVSVKPGDAASPNTSAIALIPNGNFEVDVYLAENDMTKVKVGDSADVTLDAYGTGRIFPATVSTIETSPSIDPNFADGTTGGYKVTLVFNNADSAIANGMHANATIHAGNVQNVLTIPTTAIITNGSNTFVLKKTASGLVQTPVVIGLEGSTTAQVVSGLSAGDTISRVGAQ